jgi:diguanylate cyclase (GGDEF)-like protein
LVEARVVWGASPPTDTEFPLEDCWALRRGRAHGRTEIEGGFLCRHVSDEEAYLCIPMAAHGSALGLLHVALASGDSGSWDERQALAGRVAEHLALALAKLGLQETLQHLSVRDALTGLFNRRYLDETLARDLHRAKRQGTRVGVMMIDIDHFKRVNDTLGHDAGDMLLKELGALLQRQIRSGDLACRYGGEEFTIVLQDVSQEVALRRAEQICESARQMSVRHGDNVLGGVTVSIGVALSPVDGTTREAVVKAADVALYRAKHEGRDRVCAADTGSDPPTTAEPE